MKFYGHGVVWDKENNKTLCRFENGILETNDDRVKTGLIARGYACDPEEEYDDAYFEEPETQKEDENAKSRQNSTNKRTTKR